MIPYMLLVPKCMDEVKRQRKGLPHSQRALWTLDCMGHAFFSVTLGKQVCLGSLAWLLCFGSYIKILLKAHAWVES